MRKERHTKIGSILSKTDVKKINTLYECKEYPQLYQQTNSNKDKVEHTTRPMRRPKAPKPTTRPIRRPKVE